MPHKGTFLIYCCLRTWLPVFKTRTGLLCRHTWKCPVLPGTAESWPTTAAPEQRQMTASLKWDPTLIHSQVSSKTLVAELEKRNKEFTLCYNFIFSVKTMPQVLNQCLVKAQGHQIGNTVKHNFCHQPFPALPYCRSSVALIKGWEGKEDGVINSWRNVIQLMGKKENKEHYILNIFLQPWRRISANPLTDSMFKSIFLRHIIARLPWVLYPNKQIYCTGKDNREWGINVESFPHQVSTQGVCRQPDFPPALQRRIWGVDKQPPCADCIGGKGLSPDVHHHQLQRFLPPHSSSQLSSLTSTKTTSAKTK